jgi:RES domain-containing protein
MNVFRISQTKYINDITGTGAKQFGGRWNKPGVAALYTSEARSLAMLELIVHFASKQAFEQSYSFLNLEINEKLIVNINEDYLPKNILSINDNRLWDITEHYFFKENALAIKVPSVLISQEFNIIINPIHARFNEVIIKSFETVNLDERFKNTK